MKALPVHEPYVQLLSNLLHSIKNIASFGVFETDYVDNNIDLDISHSCYTVAIFDRKYDYLQEIYTVPLEKPESIFILEDLERKYSNIYSWWSET